MQLAARRAFNMAIDKPGLDIPKSASPVGTNLSYIYNLVGVANRWVSGSRRLGKGSYRVLLIPVKLTQNSYVQVL